MKRVKRLLAGIVSLLLAVTIIGNENLIVTHAATLPTSNVFISGSTDKGYNAKVTYDLKVSQASKMVLTCMSYGDVSMSYYSADLSERYDTVYAYTDSAASPVTKVITAYVSPGTYKVVIDNERSAASRYQIKASISSLGANDIEPNDFDHAMTLNKGATITGALTTQDKEDWYKITTTSKFVRLSISAYEDMDINVYNQDLSETLDYDYLYGKPASPDQQILEFCGSNVYYVKVSSGSWDDGGKYKLSWTAGTVPTVKNVKLQKLSSTEIKVTWDQNNAFDYYQVYRATSEKGKYSLLGVYNKYYDTKYSTGLKTGTKYYYKVRGYRVINKRRVMGAFSPVVSATPSLKAPKNLTVSQSVRKALSITWNYDGEASYYQLYRASSLNGKYALLGTYDKYTTYKRSTSLTSGRRYYYKVRSYKWVSGKRVFSPFSDICSGVAK